LKDTGAIHISDLMVRIPGGVEELRDDRKKIEWKVEIQPFRISRYPLSEEIYNDIAGDLRPAVNISWNDALSFCNRLSRKSGLKECYSIPDDFENIVCDWEADGYRFPTEAEWQYACKAGTSGYRYGEIDAIAWYAGNSAGRIHESGKKEPNAWGLYDMLGNVWEWCWDVYDEQVYGAYRVFRGGSWADEARSCGATCRRRSHPSFRIDDLGFRLAQSG
jgi:formylglycine-generating enzyme required for sulfatase activity